MSDMPRPRPPHLQRGRSRHGKVYWFVQVKRGAPKIRIREEFGTPAFDAAYQAAVTSDHPKKPEIKVSHGTIMWAWLLYRQSASWQSAISTATRRQRENIMKHVLATAGSQPLSAITGGAIREGVDRRAKTPFQAKNFVQTMRSLFEWLRENGIVSVNPCDGVKVKKPKTKGFPEWSYEDILQYEARWPIGTRERVMLDVYAYTGLRRGDAAVVGRQHIRNGIISLQTEKTGQVGAPSPSCDVLQAHARCRADRGPGLSTPPKERSPVREGARSAAPSRRPASRPRHHGQVGARFAQGRCDQSRRQRRNRT